MKKSALLYLFPLLLSGAVQAEEREWVPYKKLVEASRLDKFYAIPAAERDKVNLYLKLQPKNKDIKPAELTLTILHGSERIPVAIGADGRFMLVPNAKLLSDEAKTLISLPTTEKAGFGYDMLTPLPEGLQWKYAPLMSSVQQANKVVGSMAGAMSMFAPTVKVVVFKFAKPAQLKVEAKDGVKLYSSDAKNQIRLKPDSALLKENPLMLASERPLEAGLDTEERRE